LQVKVDDFTLAASVLVGSTIAHVAIFAYPAKAVVPSLLLLIGPEVSEHALQVVAVAL